MTQESRDFAAIRGTHWDDETDAEAAEFFDTLSVPEMRKRQDLCELQLQMAWDQNNEAALADLHRMQDALFQSMMRRCS